MIVVVWCQYIDGLMLNFLHQSLVLNCNVMNYMIDSPNEMQKLDYDITKII